MNAYLKLIRLDKPIGFLLVLWPTLSALLIAYDYQPPWLVILIFIAEAFLTRSFGCVLSDFFDHKFDALVARTKNRPIPAGDISTKNAFSFAILLIAIAFILAITTLHPRTIIASFIVLFFIVTYPLTKRFLSIPQLYLAITWSSGIILAFIESGQVKEKWFLCLILCLINIFWTMAFDTIYALVDEQYDRVIKIKSSAILFNHLAVPIIKFLYYLYMIFLIYLGNLLHMKWPYYLLMCILWFNIVYIFRLIADKDPNRCLLAFLSNNKIGYLTYAAFLTEIFYKIH